jgi:GTP-binding protein
LKAVHFVDVCPLLAFAGNGGNGCASFRREKRIPRGGPDGGDGGRGGHVTVRADPNEDNLLSIWYAPHRRAGHGEHGRGKQQYGKNGRDIVVPVPCGTVVWDEATGEIVGEVVAAGQELLVARGGTGGRGNMHWRTSVNRAPRQFTKGDPGEEKRLRLELKLIADVGLVGFPNAGKSSLLAGLSDARPKIAPYPFTTLHPMIGTLIYDDMSRLRVADIPGLIEGAHAGTGLGHEFLRHVERAACLAFVIDMAGVDGREPWADYRTLRREIKLHRADLAERPSLVIANKMDLPEAAENLPKFVSRTRTRPLRVSAVTGEGLPALREAIRARRGTGTLA